MSHIWLKLEKKKERLPPELSSSSGCEFLISATLKSDAKSNKRGEGLCLHLARVVEMLRIDRGVDTSPPPVCLILRSEEHTSELQSQSNLVCRLLLERKKMM